MKQERDELRSRERKARAEAKMLKEHFALMTTSSKAFASSVRERSEDRQRSWRRLTVQYDGMRALTEAADLEDAAPRILEVLGDGLGCTLGTFWIVDEEADLLRCGYVWRSPGTPPGGFEDACWEASFQRGAGLPGKVWESGWPAWIEDVLEEDEGFVRKEVVVGEGLRSAFAFPIRNSRTFGVLEFFSREVSPPDKELLQIATIIGDQIGQIVERWQAETELQESEERFRTFFNTAAVGAAQVDAITGRFLQVNRRLRRFLGYSEKELLSMTFFQVTHPDDRARVQEGLAALLRGEIREHLTEKRYCRKNGRIVWGQLAVSLVRDTNGNPLHNVAVVQDVTERKRAEEQVQFQAHLLEQFEAAVIATDLQGTVIYWNKYAEQLYGWSREEAAARNIVELTVGPTEVEVAEEIMEQLRAGEGWEGEFVVRRKDGSTLTIHIANSLIYDVRGHRVGIVGVSTDITKRKRAEEQLRESEERYKILYEDNPSMYFTLDTEGRILSVNSYGAEHLGYAVDEVVGRPMVDLFHEEDREGASRYFDACLRNPEQVDAWEARKVRKDGSTVWVQENARTARGSDDTIVLVNCEDVTQRKRAEETLQYQLDVIRTITNNAADALFLWDAEGRVTFMNPAAEQTFGWRQEELLGEVLHDRVHHHHPDGRPYPMSECPLVRVAESGQALYDHEDLFFCKDGSPIEVACSHAPIVAGREITGAVLVVRDITERRRAEEVRERSLARELRLRAQAEERRRISRELHDRVAHAIGVVHQSLELHEALKERHPARAAGKMVLAKRTAKDALRLTRDLSMELRNPEVRRGLEAALSDLLSEIVPDTVTSELSVDGDESLVPHSARDQLFLILREAIRNAVVHSGCERLAVEVNVTPQRLAGSVEDDGRGFEPDGSRNGGGLKSMKERATLVGGALVMSSEPGAGTKVEVSMPLEDT